MHRICALTFVLLAVWSVASVTGQTPYADLQSRDVKALSSEQVDAYLQGSGMGLALSAELNGFPGPKHVLELAEELELGTQQHAAIARVFDSMHHAAVSLGERIVAAERALDRAFADGSISRGSLERAVVDIGTLQGELRAVHLAAHLETLPLLDAGQVERYAHLRGYGEADHSAMEHHGHR